VAITGDELLKLIKDNAGASGKQLAEQAGYTTTTKTGQVRVKMLAFQNAVLSANKINFKDTPSESKGVRGGRKASFFIQVQNNGNLLIGSAYTKQMGLEPGTYFTIQPGRKQFKLIQEFGLEEERSESDLK
jgi:AbrB-like transcriptional regulator